MDVAHQTMPDQQQSRRERADDHARADDWQRHDAGSKGTSLMLPILRLPERRFQIEISNQPVQVVWMQPEHLRRRSVVPACLLEHPHNQILLRLGNHVVERSKRSRLTQRPPQAMQPPRPYRGDLRGEHDLSNPGQSHVRSRSRARGRCRASRTPTGMRARRA